jgi:hypothetical protein
MKTAIKLCEYDDILNPRYIYSLLCLAALKNRFFGICSKAFVKVRCTSTQPLHIVSLTVAVHVSPAGDASHPVRGRPRRHPDAGRADLHQERALGPGHASGAVPEVPGGGPLLQGLRHLRQVTSCYPIMYTSRSGCADACVLCRATATAGRFRSPRRTCARHVAT